MSPRGLYSTYRWTYECLRAALDDGDRDLATVIVAGANDQDGTEGVVALLAVSDVMIGRPRRARRHVARLFGPRPLLLTDVVES